MTFEPAQLSLSVAGSSSGIERVCESFETFSSAHALPDDVRRSIQVVLDELLSNTVRCGKVGERPLTIEVGFRLEPYALRVEILDDGPPFNPLEREAPDTTLPLEQRPVGGLGVMLVRNLVDQITYDFEEGRNRVLLRKRLET